MADGWADKDYDNVAGCTALIVPYSSDMVVTKKVIDTGKKLLGLYRLIHKYVSSQKEDFCIYGTAPEFEPYQSVLGLEEGYEPDDIYIESRFTAKQTNVGNTSNGSF